MNNIKPLNVSNHFTGLTRNNNILSDTKTTQSFKSILKNSLDSSSVESKLDDVEREPLREIPEDRPKCCSLCGSPIDDEGKCPMCIIPLYISGDQLNQQAQSTSETQSIFPLQGNSDMNLMLGKILQK